MAAYPGRDGYVGAPSGVVWQTNADGVTEGVDTAGAPARAMVVWAPDLFGTGQGGFVLVAGIPAIPSDWNAQEVAGTPYVLGIADGIPAWRLSASPILVPTGDFSDDFSEDFS